MICIRDWDAPNGDKPNAPFPPEITSDPWTLYHGTSSIHEKSIEEEGLSPRKSLFTAAEIRAVIDIFGWLGWAGRTGSSLGVLKPFSMHDVAAGHPVFLGESVQRCSLYATRDFAGGEIARGLRHSFWDFDAFLADPELRQASAAQRRSADNDLRNLGGIPKVFETPKLAEVAASIEDLGAVRDRANALLEGHQYGLIYAVRSSEAYLSDLEYSGFMGVMCSRVIAVTDLVAKAVVPIHGAQGDIAFKRFPPTWQGVVPAIRAQEQRRGMSSRS